MIPKLLHQFWDGPRKPPEELMSAWKTAYETAGWKYYLWCSSTIRKLNKDGRLINQKQYDAMPEWCGKCDIARYEILNKMGGFFIDADSRFIRLIDENLLQHSFTCCYENEFIRPGLISCGYMGSEANSHLTGKLIEKIGRLEGTNLHSDYGKSESSKTEAWKTTGPVLLTNTISELGDRSIAVFPSFFFIPNHYLSTHPSARYKGDFTPYCDSLWGSTPGSEYQYQENPQTSRGIIKKGLPPKPLPTISICTLTYNRRNFLPLLQLCIENQNYPKEKIEWLVFDDSDNYDDHLSIKSETPIQIKYQRLAKKLALGAKRNLAHRLCDGDIIVYMDDDDYYPPDRVSHAVETLQQSGKDLAGCTVLPIFFTEDSQLWISGPFAQNHATAGTFAMTRKFARNNQYDPSAECNEEKGFLKDYSIPMAQLNPAKTMICIAHQRNTFDKNKMRANGPTPRMRIAQPEEVKLFTKDFDPQSYSAKNQ